MASEARLRPPLPSDTAALAALAAELGYPTGAEELLGRLAALHPTDAAVIVSTDADDVPTGWCHVEMRRTLVEPQSAMIVGLVIGDGRPRGVRGEQDLVLPDQAARLIGRGRWPILLGASTTRSYACQSSTP